jgi:hypothetical protein
MEPLHIPETVTTPFVVATVQPPHDPPAIARARLRLPLAAGLLEAGFVSIRTLPAGESGYADLMSRAAWVREEERDLLEKVTHHVVVMGRVPPVSQPDHGQAVRAIARVVAEACDGVVYDAWSHQVLPHDFRFGVEHPEFCLADDWLATFLSRRPGRFDAIAEGGLHLTTAGLHRFALPELEAVRVPVGNTFAAVTLLRCLAVTLLSEHWDWLACNPGAQSRRLPDHAWAEGRDVWRYWAAEPTGAVGGRVRVRLGWSAEGDAGTLPYLTVGPPADFGAAAAEWWNDVVDLAMPYVPAAPRRAAA